MKADIQVRVATATDVPAMAASRSTDPDAGPADPRMTAYLEGRHYPQEALAPRIAYLATVNGTVAGYTAGHLTRRYGCEGEVQYLYVAPPTVAPALQAPSSGNSRSGS